MDQSTTSGVVTAVVLRTLQVIEPPRQPGLPGRKGPVYAPGTLVTLPAGDAAAFEAAGDIDTTPAAVEAHQREAQTTIHRLKRVLQKFRGTKWVGFSLPEENRLAALEKR